METLSTLIGEMGKFQFFTFLITSSMEIPTAMHTFSMTFYAPNVDYWCSRPDNMRNVSVDEWRDMSAPWKEMDGLKIFDNCKIRDVDFANASQVDSLRTHSHNETKSCSKWEFDLGIYDRTMREEFQLVCDRDILISISNSVYMAGFMVGVLLGGHLSDRYGRKTVAVTNIGIVGTVTIVMAFSPSFEFFMVLRFFQCLSMVAAGLSSFVLFTELCSSKYRATLGNLYYIGFSIGITAFSGVAYLLKNWFHILLASGIPYILIFALMCCLSESPRWLITNNKLDAAAKVVKRARKMNGMKVCDDTELMSRLEHMHKKEKSKSDAIQNKKHNVIDLFKSPNVRKKTLNLYFCWMVTSFVYYGLTFHTNNLGGDPFINFLISGAVEIPALPLAAFMVAYCGRRLSLATLMVIGGVCCGVTALIPDDGTLVWLQITFSMIGKFCIASAFAMIYVYSAELFPTVLRNTGVGSCSTIARIGSILAPYVKELGKYTHKTVPSATFGILATTSGLLILLLPETKGCSIPDTLEEAENIKRVTFKKSKTERNKDWNPETKV